MIKAIIFDLNGVFIQSPYLSDRFQKEFGVSKEDFLPALKNIMAKARKPNAGSSFNYWKPYFQVSERNTNKRAKRSLFVF